MKLKKNRILGMLLAAISIISLLASSAVYADEDDLPPVPQIEKCAAA